MYNDKTFFLEDATGNFQLKGFALTEGDAKISINGGPFVNLTNLPSVRQPDSVLFDLVLTDDEDVPGAEIRIEDQDSTAVFLPISISISESVIPTVDENAQAIESRLANGGDGIDLGSIFATAFEERFGNEADGDMSLALIVSALTASPIFMQLVSNAATAANNSGTGTGNSGITVQQLNDAVADTLKFGDNVVFTNIGTGGVDRVTIGRGTAPQ